MPNEAMLSTQQTTEAASKPVELSTCASAGAPTTFPPCRAIMCNVGGTYKLYFRNEPNTAMTMILADSLVYPFSLVKMTNTDDTLCTANAIHLLY